MGEKAKIEKWKNAHMGETGEHKRGEAQRGQYGGYRLENHGGHRAKRRGDGGPREGRGWCGAATLRAGGGGLVGVSTSLLPPSPQYLTLINLKKG